MATRIVHVLSTVECNGFTLAGSKGACVLNVNGTRDRIVPSGKVARHDLF